MAIYFRARDRREVSASEALDARGILRHGYGQRVPATLRDGVSRLTDARAFWDQHRDALVVTDARAVGGVEGCRPGFRILDNNLGRQAKLDAYQQYEAELTSAYRNPPGVRKHGVRTVDARDCPDCNGEGEHANGETGERCGGSGELDDDNGDNGETATSDRRVLDVDAMSAAHQQNMAKIYDSLARALSEEWRAGKGNK